MKPTAITSAKGPLHEEALQALREAGAKVIAEHRRLGIPVITWRNGKVVEISADEAQADYDAAKAKDATERAAAQASGKVPTHSKNADEHR